VLDYYAQARTDIMNYCEQDAVPPCWLWVLQRWAGSEVW